MADGDYTRLVLLAQGDQDVQHRAQAMAQISVIAPFVGYSSGHNPADAMATPVIARLYPQARPGPQDDAAAAIAAIEADARERIEQIIAGARAGAQP